MGINVTKMTIFSFRTRLATAIAAIAGVVVAPTTTLQFNSGQLFTISGFIAVVIGGISSFPWRDHRWTAARIGNAACHRLRIFAFQQRHRPGDPALDPRIRTDRADPLRG